ncbi:MAG: accessory Sec system translocase SecA2 [bacterium]|nr:accessory Sec system translocase SecA2 [bacterium]
MKHKTELKSYQNLLEEINRQRTRLESSPDRWIREKSEYLIKQTREGIKPGTLLTESFSLACEAARRVLGLQPYDVQITAATAMFNGHLAEMQTGEGKTLAAVLTAYLAGLSRKGVHILTFNDYLAHRDAHWMGPVFQFLGLTTAFVREGMSTRQRQSAYRSDVTYVTAKEAGFDFLRDQRRLHPNDLVQRPYHFAIVDEADSILIDEARVPMVIAGETPIPSLDHYALARLIRHMNKDKHYYSDHYSRDVNFTETGLDQIEKSLGCGHLHDPSNNQLFAALNLALQAQVLLKRDIDYILRNHRVELIDAFTGRVVDNRRWPYGLQTAVEAKEELQLQPEGMILGSITLQHLLKLYPRVAGMTATAKTSADEFREFYRLEVVQIPPNRPCIRIDHPDAVFTHKEAKEKALAREIAALHATGRPVLVGTASVEESEHLARCLQQAAVSCNVLNARNDEAEAKIIAEAGALSSVTISTNMAGRGTDIRLGGKDHRQREKVVQLGGLMVIGTNRHESRRIDHQLRGRAGRQGDPGASRFFISLEDDLVVRYRLDELIPPKHRPQKQDNPISNRIVAREIARAQRIIEGQNFEIRKTLRNYSFMIEDQRKILQQRRRDILLDNETLTLLSEHPATSQRYRELLPQVGKEVLTQVEKQITLFHMDRNWTQHLDYISHVREGIHLLGFAGKNPSYEFQKMAITAFDEIQPKIEEGIIASFNSARITKTGIDPEAEGLKRPSSTWTYMINDVPFENPMHGALVSSNAFAFGAALFAVSHLPLIPFVFLWRAIHKLLKKKLSRKTGDGKR